MKQKLRLIVPALVLALVLCLSLGACDLRNRQSSEDFIPTGTHAPVYQGGGTGEGEGETLPGELPGQQITGSRPVKTVLSQDGDIPLSQPVRQYYYRLPMIDLPGVYAAGCNQEIDARFGSLIRQSLEAMEAYEDPELETLTFTDFIISGILTLRIDARYADGSLSQAYYTVDAATGDQVEAERFLEAVGITEELQTLLTRIATERYESLYQVNFGSDPAYNVALTETLAEISQMDGRRMHLTEAGELMAAFTIWGPQGTVVMEELQLR